MLRNHQSPVGFISISCPKQLRAWVFFCLFVRCVHLRSSIVSFSCEKQRESVCVREEVGEAERDIEAS